MLNENRSLLVLVFMGSKVKIYKKIGVDSTHLSWSKASIPFLEGGMANIVFCLYRRRY